MKSGTAQKLVLNMLSTATMIRLGYVAGNRMTNMLPRNAKLRARAIRIIVAEADTDEQSAGATLDSAGGQLPVAIVMLKTGRSSEESTGALGLARGVVSRAITLLRS
jgi:N-acetylmuramic acid 6-phosphate etherase